MKYSINKTREEKGQVSKSKISLRDTRGSVISFHDIYYTVQTRSKFCKRIEKNILMEMSGLFKPGMNAILGPTGGGKSSLLDVLAGRKNPNGLSGIVLVDGKKQPKSFNRVSGYVVQDDVVMGTLTVRENLMFSANLRLSNSTTIEEKNHRVEDTIIELGLSKCAESKVGTEFIRGISGGERKRTNIGMELIIAPSVLFLDEPTTGLDASTANAIMTVLYNLSRHGHTIIFSIHQPRYSIYKLFDRLMLLGDGKTIYHGPAKDGLTYFQLIGYNCEEHNNPPDFFLDVINGDSTAVKATAVNSEHFTNPISTNFGTIENQVAQEGAKVPLTTELNQKFKQSSWFQSLMEEASPIYAQYLTELQSDNVQQLKGLYATSPIVQVNYLAQRSLLNLVRNPQSIIIQTIVVLIFAIIIGLIFLQLNYKLLTHEIAFSNRSGAIFFITVNQMFGSISAVELFIKERVIFLHENSNGFYRVSTYFFSKIFCDLIPMRIVPLTVFTIVVYFMIGFEHTAGQFFLFYLIIFLTNMSSCSIGFIIGASIKINAIANLLITLIFVLMLLFGGFLANTLSMGGWLNWLQYFSIVRYSINAHLINQFRYSTFNILGPNNDTIKYTEGLEEINKKLNIVYNVEWDLWQNIFALIIIIIILMSLTYIQLRRIPKYK